MKKKIVLIFAICFFLAGVVAASDLPLQGNCPDTETLTKNKEWVEHTEGWNRALTKLMATHLKYHPESAKPAVSMSLTPVTVDRGAGICSWNEVVWQVSRTNQKEFSGKSGNCRVIGTTTYYVEMKNKNGWPPRIDFINKPVNEERWLVNGDIGLIELRWYDPVGKRRHRWFNRRLAKYMQWVTEGEYSPIQLPRVVNSLD